MQQITLSIEFAPTLDMNDGFHPLAEESGRLETTTEDQNGAETAVAPAALTFGEMVADKERFESAVAEAIAANVKEVGHAWAQA